MKSVVVVKRCGPDVDMRAGRDHWWHELMADASAKCPPAKLDAEHPLFILYTSGTTGKPKGAELTHSNMVLNARLSDTMYHAQDHDTHLITLPLFHSFGQSVQMNAGFYNKATLTLLARFDPDAALAIMDRDDVTIFAGVPTMYWAMLNHPNPEKYDLKKIASNLRLAVSGGSAMPVVAETYDGRNYPVYRWAVDTNTVTAVGTAAPVMHTVAPKLSAASPIRSSSVAITTSLAPLSRPRRNTCSIMGLPLISRNGLPGKRVDA